MKTEKRRYLAIINGNEEYVFAKSPEDAKRLFKRRAYRKYGYWKATDFLVESDKQPGKYNRISFGFDGTN